MRERDQSQRGGAGVHFINLILLAVPLAAFLIGLAVGFLLGIGNRLMLLLEGRVPCGQ